MDFMTQGTLRNLPAYLAEHRAARLEKQQQEEVLKQQAYEAQMNKVAQAFINKGDFSAAGLKSFADTNKLSMPEIKGLMNIAATFKQLEKQRVETPKVWARNPDGTQTRVADEEGIVSHPAPEAAKEPSYVWARDPSGKSIRVRDQEGLESYPTPEKATEKEEKVPDHIKYAVNTLSKSLGYGLQSGWPDKASEQKFNMVMQNVDAIMKDKDPSEINQVLFDTIKMYDTELKAAKTVEAIPKNTAMTTVKDAKTIVDRAVEAGAKTEEIAGELMRKGWKEKDIKKILKMGEAELKTLKEKALPQPSERLQPGDSMVGDALSDEPPGLPPINTADQIETGKVSPDNPLGL